MTIAGCGGDDSPPAQGNGTTVLPPAPIVGAGAGGAAAPPVNPGAVGMGGAAGGSMQPQTPPVVTMPVAGNNPMTAGSGSMMAGSGSMMMAGSGGRGMGTGGRGGSGGMMAGGGMGGMGGMMAGGGPAPGCVENLTCQLSPPASTGDAHQDCVDRINQFRTQCACMTPLARWTEGEACADMMSEYDSTQPTAHAGFRARICMPGGSSQNECPGWRSTMQIIDRCLQSMWNEGPPPTQPCDGACFQEYGHFINMTSKTATKVACGFFTTPEGEIWSVQNFSR